MLQPHWLLAWLLTFSLVYLCFILLPYCCDQISLINYPQKTARIGISKSCHFLHPLFFLSFFPHTLFSHSLSLADSLYNSHLSDRSLVADCALFNPSLTSSNWSVDRAISVLALPSDKGQTSFPTQPAGKGRQGVCVSTY